MLTAIIHGLVLAFGLILPLGVQNVFVFNQGITQPNFIRALPVIITASLCDTLLITLAILGVSIIVFGNPIIKLSILLIGIGFLIYMGYLTWKSKPNHQGSEEKALSPKKQMAFAASVSLLNPHAIMDTIGVIGTSSLSYSGTDKLLFALSCIFVSWIWFFGLAFIGRMTGKFFDSQRFIIILNKISAIIMWCTAIYLATTL
ncbi:LysE/ArgO family amino acid transporter [Peribacillus tepidiphilus]|uniref:LysE/ArgO family amino acid transporter n=1 Tax=Peribacillus tepidiphilus TaxID=2652445 RepID=UPI0035B52E0C